MFFFFGKKKKKKKPEQAPKWFIWLMGGFVAYAILTNLLTDKVAEVQRQTLSGEEEKAAKSETEYFNYPAVSGVGVAGREDDKRTLFASDIETGQGKPVDCWYRVTVDYRLYDRNGKLLDDSEKDGKQQSFTVGKGEVPLAMERGVMGMKEGSKRAVTAHPSQLFDKTGFYHSTMGEGDYGGYILTLKEMVRPDNLPLSDLGLRIYDDKLGEGKLAQCTDKVRIKLHGWLAGSGESLWKDRELPGIKLRVGEGVAPYAVERGVMGMKVGGKRTLIVPPGYMKPLSAVVEQPEAAGAPQAEDEAEPVEQTPAEKMAAELERRLDDNFAWGDLPVPLDQVIILEIDLLPEKLNMPDGFVAE